MKRFAWTIVLVALLLSLTACRQKTPEEQIAAELDLNATKGTELLHYDTHSGNGDGVSCFALTFSDNSLEQDIAGRSDWAALPLDKTTQILAYGQSDQTGSMGPYLTDRDGNALLPPIESGYYRLIDRQASEKSLAAAQPILERASFNLTLAIYDADKDILYYCHLDT